MSVMKSACVLCAALLAVGAARADTILVGNLSVHVSQVLRRFAAGQRGGISPWN